MCSIEASIVTLRSCRGTLRGRRMPHALRTASAQTRGSAFTATRTVLRGTRSAAGATTSEITHGSPADKAGLREDDVILTLDGRPCATPRTLDRRLEAAGPGKHVKVEVLRDGKLQVSEADLGEVPLR